MPFAATGPPQDLDDIFSRLETQPRMLNAIHDLARVSTQARRFTASSLESLRRFVLVFSAWSLLSLARLLAFHSGRNNWARATGSDRWALLL